MIARRGVHPRLINNNMPRSRRAAICILIHKADIALFAKRTAFRVQMTLINLPCSFHSDANNFHVANHLLEAVNDLVVSIIWAHTIQFDTKCKHRWAGAGGGRKHRWWLYDRLKWFVAFSINLCRLTSSKADTKHFPLDEKLRKGDYGLQS